MDGNGHVLLAENLGKSFKAIKILWCTYVVWSLLFKVRSNFQEMCINLNIIILC